MNHYQSRMHLNKKAKRGLSSIVTGAILLSAVAIMGVVIVIWANSNLVKHQQNLDATISDNFNKINEKLLIEHVWFDNVGPSMNVTMNNIGTIGLNVTEINITDMDSDQIYSFLHTDGGILPGDTLSVDENFNWAGDTPYEVIIVTERNSQFKMEVNSP